MGESLLSVHAARNRELWDGLPVSARHSAESTGLADASFDVVFCGHTLDEPGETVAFQLPYGTWIRLFRENELVVEDLLKLRPPTGATSSYRDDLDLAWARCWPMEHIWRVRRSSTRLTQG